MPIYGLESWLQRRSLIDGFSLESFPGLLQSFVFHGLLQPMTAQQKSVLAHPLRTPLQPGWNFLELHCSLGFSFETLFFPLSLTGPRPTLWSDGFPHLLWTMLFSSQAFSPNTSLAYLILSWHPLVGNPESMQVMLEMSQETGSKMGFWDRLPCGLIANGILLWLGCGAQIVPGTRWTATDWTVFPLNSSVESLAPRVTVFEDGALRR